MSIGRLALFIIFFLVLTAAPTNAAGLNIGAGCELALNDGALDVAGDIDIAISGTLTAGTGAIALSGNWVQNGVFSPGMSTVKFTGLSGQTLSGNTTFYNLSINNTHPTEKVDASGSTGLVVENTLEVTNGIFRSQSAYKDVTIENGATLELSGNITVSGNWTNNGPPDNNGLAPGTHKVTLNGDNQSISGITTFYDLTKVVATAATLTFPGGNKTTITNALTLQGANGQLLSLLSDSVTQWEIDPQGARTIQYLDVQRSKNVNAQDIDVRGKDCTDSGENTKWIFDNTLLAPKATTQAVTGIGDTTATGNGNVTDLGNPNPTAHGVCWNTSGTPTINDNKKDLGPTGTKGAFTAPVSGLTPGTTYYVRAYAANSQGTAYGTDTTFTTMPAVTTTAVSSITPTTAASGGNITSGAGAAITAKGVCWSTSANPTIAQSHTSDGTGTGVFASSITGLSPGTTYHVRAYATYSADTAYGTDLTFTTPTVEPGTYYVDIVNGNDSNDGSKDFPWKTLHHAISQLNGGSPGDYVLRVAPGTYSVSGINGEADSQLILSQSNVIISGEQGNAPVVDGTGATTWTKGIEITGSNNAVKNLSVTGFTNQDPPGEGIRISGGTTNEVAGCNVHGNNFGIRISESTSSKVKYCDIYENSTHGMDVIFSTGTMIVKNTIHGNPNYGIRVESSPEISRNEIYDNLYGILVESMNNDIEASPVIKNNVIYEKISGSMSYGIFMRSNNSSTVSPVIYHNTIDGGADTGIVIEKDTARNIGGVSASGTTGSTAEPDIKYNIITNFTEYGIANTQGNPSIDYNDVWNNTTENFFGCSKGPSGISEDPIYVNDALQNYELQNDEFQTSPCIDAIGLETEDPVRLDFPGYKRPRDNGFDMGAYEYVSPETYNFVLPGGIGLATDYRIFTVPFTMTGAEVLAEMEAILGTYDQTQWRTFAFVNGNYIEFNDSTTFPTLNITPGMGFWIITVLTDTIPFQGQIAPDGVDFRMPLKSGWHLIALPWFNTNMKLGDIQVTDGVNTYSITNPNNTLTQKFVWDYTGGTSDNGYVKWAASDDILQHGVGYFFKVSPGANVTVIFPINPAANAQKLRDTSPGPEGRTIPGGNDLPPPPPGAPTVPDIKVNGQDGPMTIISGDPVSVTVSLTPGSWEDRTADWWIATHNELSDPPYDWYTYVYPTGWQAGISAFIQSPLSELSPPLQVLNTVLPEGDYTFYFAIDNNADGNFDGTWMDSVEVKVE